MKLSATTRDASGAVLTGRVVTWSSSNSAVATVSGSGEVMGVTVGGPVTITATSEGQSGSVAVSVVNPIVTSVAISPATTAVSIGGTTFLAADVRDQNNVSLTKQVVTWTTSNAAIATVSPMATGSQSALVTGVAAGGPVTITATIAGKSGTAAVTVTSSPCDASTPITIGQTLSGALASTDCTLQDGSFMDLYTISITANGRLQIDVTSTAFDAYLILFLRNPDGTTVAVGADDNSGGGTNSRITRDVVAGETYLIGANSLLANVTGAYQVSVQTGTFMIVGESHAAVVGARAAAIAKSKLGMAAKALR
ncbi:MAG TPA: Ig-like domain-containing protein [Gemmatimonadaceae bacterium]